MNGRSCTACNTSKGPCVQGHSGVIETNARSLPPIGLLHIGPQNPKRTRAKPPDSTTDRRLHKNRQKARNTLGSRSLLHYKEASVSTLQARCHRLEQDNATLLKAITEMEDKSMKSATQHLLQYDRAGSNLLAVQLWADRQIRDAQQDLEKIKAERQARLSALCGQLEACEEKLQEAQKDLQQLREYRDRGHSLAVLQAADLERQLRILNETHQDQAADVEALAQTELQKLLDDRQTVKEEALQAIVEQHIERLPLSLRRMCLQNREMKQDIQVYQQMVKGLKDEVSYLQESGESLCKSWKEERERLSRDLLLRKPSCSPDEDVVLNIPLSQKLPI